MNEGEEGFGEFVVAGGDAAEVLDASEEALDQIAVSMEMAIKVSLSK